MKSVLEAAEDLGTEFTTADVVDHPAVEIGERQVLEHLKKLIRRGDLSGQVDGGSYTWEDDSLHRVSEHGDAELTPVSLKDLGAAEVDELPRSSTYTWKFVKVSAREAITPGTCSSAALDGEGWRPNKESDPPNRGY